MIIQTDTRQQMQRKHHQIKEQWFLDNGHEVIRSKCLVGDYICPSNGSVAVDTKQSCSELYADLIQDHARFHDECVRAKKCGIRLIILVENDLGFTKPRDILKWRNPQMYRFWKAQKEGVARKQPASNVQLLKIMNTMHREYGVEFEFCSTAKAGARIVEILSGGKHEEEP